MMNKTKLFTVVALMAANVTFAQRATNMEATLEAPLDGSSWTNGTEVPITVSVTNHGPDDLVTGDTLFFVTNIEGVGVLATILTEGIPSDASATVYDDVLGLTAPSTPFNADLCVTVLDPATAGITIGGVPVVLTYEDADTTNNSSCSNISLVEEDTSGTGIINVNVDSREPLNIYPNPATDKINFAVTVQQSVAASITVTDMTGRAIITEAFGTIVAGKQEELSLDVAALPAGMYFVTLHAGERSFVGKVTIQR